MQACDRCHSRKIRCDRRAPRCSVCERANAECVHTDRVRDRKLSRGYVQSLEDKVRLLEERNEELRRSTALAYEDQGDRIPGSNDLDLEPQLTSSSVSEPSSTQIDCPASLETRILGTATCLTRSTHAPIRQEVLNPLIARGTSRQYLGSSTNVDFVKIVASNFKDSLPVPEPAEVPTSPDVPTVSDDAALPPRIVAQELIDAYFAHWHITFPLLHRASLRGIVDQIYDRSGYYKDEPFHAFAFDMVLAMGSVSRNRHEWSAFTTESYFARAMNKLDKVLRLPDIVPLQALLLCCHYGVFSTLRDTSTDTWHLLGLAARFSTELGLHRRHGYKSEGTSAMLSNLSDVHSLEMSRRCFWCLYNLDRSVLFRSLTCTLLIYHFIQVW
jgi:hypothetical protein